MISRDTIALFDATKAALEICRIVEEPDSGAPSFCTIFHLGFPPRAPQHRTRFFVLPTALGKVCPLILMLVPSRLKVALPNVFRFTARLMAGLSLLSFPEFMARSTKHTSPSLPTSVR
jgi:hypothetical protein